MNRLFTTLASALIATTAAQARTDTVTVIRPVESAYTLQAGSSHLADTYLAPVKMNGWHTSLTYTRTQAMRFDPDRWVMHLSFGIEADRAFNPPRNTDMWYGGILGTWGMTRRWQLPSRLSVGIGGSTSINAGCFYMQRNGNNPASAKAAWTVNADAYATWHTTMGRLPVRLRYHAILPLIGAHFSPQYGELYYEIYLGNRNGLVHCAAWPQYLEYRHRFMADFDLGSVSLRLGYAGNILSTKVNHLVTHRITHAAILGISGQWISINPRKTLSQDAKIITATY